MPEENETSVKDVTEENYASMLQDVLNKKDAEIADLNKKHAASIKEITEKVVNGRTVQAETVKPVDVQDVRNKLFNEELSNLEYVEKAVALRDELIAKGEPDPFIPVGHQIVPTDEDKASAERVATAFKECIEIAQGDSQVFTNELQRRMVDTGPRRR